MKVLIFSFGRSEANCIKIEKKILEKDYCFEDFSKPIYQKWILQFVFHSYILILKYLKLAKKLTVMDGRTIKTINRGTFALKN